MAHLFSSIRIREIEFRNRIVVSPMCQYSSRDGFANDWHLVHLGSRAVGGAGLVMSEATAVSPEGRITPQDLGIWKDIHIEFLRRITDFIHSQGAVAGIQLAHAGRKASKTSPWEGDHSIPPAKGGWTPLAPSPIAFSAGDTIPEELTEDGIRKVIVDFRLAATRAQKAGFKVIEIHAAHGYLLNEFLSPLTNRRTDNYGGSFENRCRLLMEVVQEVRKVWPENLPLFVRLSCVDWHEDGWQIEDTVKLSALLKNAGVDLIDCSSGAVVQGVKIPAGPGYQVPFAEAVKKQSGILTGAVGIITTPQQANDIISKEQADFVFIARQFLRDAYFPLTAGHDLEQNVHWPVQYERANRK